MNKTQRDFYNNHNSAIAILDYDNDVKFLNTKFIKAFGNLIDLKLISHRFGFDICILDNEELQSITPITCALNAKENFFCQASYQKSNEVYLYYNISLFQLEKEKLMVFNDVTLERTNKSIAQDLDSISKNYNKLKTEHKKFAELKHRAQLQAIKMGLINRISNTMRKSISLHKIINSTIEELYKISAATKVYYAEKYGNAYQIKYIYPNSDSHQIDEIVEFDEITTHTLLENHHKISTCLKEHQNSTTTFEVPLSRLIVPIHHLEESLGIIVIFSRQTTVFAADETFIQAISGQIASAIVQAALFEEVNSKNKELEHTLKELQETQLQLINSEKMASLGQLIAGVAHEINTPLAAIHANHDLFKKLLATDSTESVETMKEINNIDLEAITRIKNIVQSLKKFVRLDEAQLQSADINKELDLTIDLIRHETKNKIEIIKNYSTLPIIKCYPNMLNQVFMNILINAIQSIENTGKITITTETQNDQLVVSFKDTGIGIKNEVKPELFNTGFTTKKQGIGTGLGLAISQKIIEKHGGSIVFTSEYGKGSDFVVTIPIR